MKKYVVAVKSHAKSVCKECMKSHAKCVGGVSVNDLANDCEAWC